MGEWRYKKINVSLVVNYVIKHYAMKAYGEVEI
jgi:hypothetical protein